VFEVADRIVVLRLGRRVATFGAGAATASQVVAAMTGADEVAVGATFEAPGPAGDERGSGRHA
jgi:D-xylose transport system ATP-binding protein